MRLGSSLLAALMVSVALACASQGHAPIEERVLSARSPADHLEIAEYYRGEAADARRMSAEHTRLAEVYGGSHRWGDAFAARARDHCNSLAASEQATAARFDTLAAEHERLARD